MEVNSREADITAIFNKGLQAHNAGDLSAAEQLYQETLAMKPEHPEANHNIGVVLVAKDELDKALQFFKFALDNSPNVSLFWASYIDTLIKLERIRESKTLIKAVKQAGISCDRIEAISRQLNDLYQEPGAKDCQALDELIEQQKFDDAIKACQSLTETYPSSAVLNINLGKCYFELGQMEQAISSYKKAIEINPKCVAAFVMLSQIHSVHGDADQAIKNLEKAINLEPNNHKLCSTIGVEFLQKGDVEEAVNYLEKSLKQNPNSQSVLSMIANAYNKLGLVLYEKGKLDEAITAYQKVLAIKPDYSDAYSNMGIALYHKDDLDGAIQSFEKAIRILPSFAEAYFHIGVCQNDKGNIKAAIGAYDKSLSLRPNFTDAHFHKGVALQQKDDFDGAIQSYKKVLEIQPDNFDTHNNMGVAFHAKGDLIAAIKSMKQSIKIRPDHTETWSNLFYPLQAGKYKKPSPEDKLTLFSEQLEFSSPKVAKSILKYKLTQGGPSAEASLAKALQLLKTFDNACIQNPLNTNALLKQPARSKKMVALVHFGRSGTGLFHSLIDNHSQVSTLPSIYFSEFFNHSTWATLIADGWNKIVDNFIQKYDVLFDARSSVPTTSKNGKLIHDAGLKEGMTNVGEQQDTVLSLDKKTFHQALTHLIGLKDHLDAFTFFKLVHAAYDLASNDYNKKHLNFYHIHNPDTYATLNFLKSAPDVSWVVMIRDPLQSCESWILKSFQLGSYSDIVTKIFQMLFEIDSSIYKNHTSIGIKLEDLKERPRKTIPAICSWLGIEEEESLYEMTAQGKKWWGDPTSPDYTVDGMKPFGKTSINRKVGLVFSKNDQFILRTLFYPFSVRFGYAKENPDQFKTNLKKIRPMLDQMFDFEKNIAAKTGVDVAEFMKSGYYLYLRSGLIERWTTLSKFNTYPNMLKPLRIK